MEEKKKARRSKEHILKMNAGHVGKHRSQAAKDKISASLKNRKWVVEDGKRRLLPPSEDGVEIKKEQRKSLLHSKLEKEFARMLDLLGIKYIQQYSVGSFRTDFYVEQMNTIYEINGCYVHCCTECGYNDSSFGTSAEEKRKLDAERKLFLESQGYIVRVICDHELFV